MCWRTILLAVVLSLAPPQIIRAEDWSPAEPVAIVVPWAAGGSTDTVTRVVAAELSSAFGQTFVVLNQPGASGALGTRSVWEAPHDGMTIAAGAVADLGAYAVLGTLDVPLDRWRLYVHVANPALISVGVKSPWMDFGELMAALESTQKPLKVASGGLTSATGISLQALEAGREINYRQIVYEGGNRAALATASGETDFTAQTATVQIDLIRAGKLRPLAVLATAPLDLDGYGTAPPITDWLPETAVAPNYFGLFLPADTPQRILSTMDRYWSEAIAHSDVLKRHAAERGALFAPAFGEEARAAALPYLSINAWQQYESGGAARAPNEVGIPHPDALAPHHITATPHQ